MLQSQVDAMTSVISAMERERDKELKKADEGVRRALGKLKRFKLMGADGSWSSPIDWSKPLPSSEPAGEWGIAINPDTGVGVVFRTDKDGNLTSVAVVTVTASRQWTVETEDGRREVTYTEYVVDSGEVEIGPYGSEFGMTFWNTDHVRNSGVNATYPPAQHPGVYWEWDRVHQATGSGSGGQTGVTSITELLPRR